MTCATKQFSRLETHRVLANHSVATRHVRNYPMRVISKEGRSMLREIEVARSVRPGRPPLEVSDLTTKRGVLRSSLPQVIFSLGTATLRPSRKNAQTP
jgi:hypothetical protein